MTGPEEQLPLGLGHLPAFSRRDFLVGDCNRDAVAIIDDWPDWGDEPLLVVGPPGSGKTHLARVFAEMAPARVINCAELGPAALDRLDGRLGLAVEDIDRAPGNETALFHVLNQAKERRAPLLMTARSPTLVELMTPPDLASRLRAARRAQLKSPDDALLRAVVVKLFADRQLSAPPTLLDYLVARMERSFAAAAKLVEELDQAALASGRPLGRQLAASVLPAVGGEDTIESEAK